MVTGILTGVSNIGATVHSIRLHSPLKMKLALAAAAWMPMPLMREANPMAVFAQNSGTLFVAAMEKHTATVAMQNVLM